MTLFFSMSETPSLHPDSNLKASSGLLSEDAQRFAVLFFATGALVFLLFLGEWAATVAGAFSNLLMIVFFAWLLAFVVSPLVEGACDRLHLGHARAVALVYGAIAAGVALFLFIAADIGVGEAQNLVRRSDEANTTISDTLSSLQNTLGLNANSIDLVSLFHQAQDTVVRQVETTLTNQLGTIAGTLVSVVGTLSLILILSIFIVSDAPGLQAKWRRIMPNRLEAQLDLFERSVSRAFRGFLWTQVILMAIQVVLTALVCLLFGLPYLFTICVIAALCMPIPLVGPGLARLPPIFVAAAFVPGALLPAALILFFVQMAIMNIAVPRLMKRAAGVHPIITIISVLVGAQIAGIWGAVFGLPVAAVVSIMANYFIDLRAVAEIEGVDLDTVVAEILAADPDATPEEVMAEAADQAEATLEATHQEQANRSAKTAPSGPAKRTRAGK